MKPPISISTYTLAALALGALLPSPWHLLPLVAAALGVCCLRKVFAPAALADPEPLKPAGRDVAQLLLEISQSVGTTLRLDAALGSFASGLRALLSFDAIALYSLQNGVLRAESTRGAAEDFAVPSEIKAGEGPAGRAAGGGIPVRQVQSAQSILALPLYQQDEVIGVLVLYARDPDAFPEDRLRTAIAAASILAGVLGNVRRYREAEESAGIDFLTELPNARALAAHLEQSVQRCERTLESLVVMVGDLDGFKAVNDHLGHQTGNRLLQRVAAALKGQCRQGDFVARMGGDEFAFVLAGPPLLSTPEIQLRFAHAVEQASSTISAVHPVRLSLGLARLGMDGDSGQQLLEAADRRMYQAKSEHKLSNTAQPDQRDLRRSPEPHRHPHGADAARDVDR